MSQAGDLKQDTRSTIYTEPAGLYVDTLHEIRKAMRTLRRAEKRIKTYIRAEKRKRIKNPALWGEVKRVFKREK